MYSCFAGHVALLKQARDRGDYLMVGIHSNSLVNKMQGNRLPLMSLNERVLSVLGCRYVDNVLIDAPYEISSSMIATLGISTVVRGGLEEGFTGDMRRFRQAKAAGILEEIEPETSFEIERVFRRIREQHDSFRSKYENKNEKERRFYSQKYSSYPR